MADHHTATAEPFETFLKGAQGRHVEIVRRLIEQQEIRPFLEHSGQVDAIALATGEILHFLLLIRAGQIETTAVGARIDFRFPKHHHVPTL